MRSEYLDYQKNVSASEHRAFFRHVPADLRICSIKQGLVGRVCARCEGKYWEPDEGGETMMVLPVVDGPEFMWDEVFDIIAWHPRDPRKTWSRNGESLGLGLWAFDPPYLDPLEELRVHPSPIEWYLSGCQGLWVRSAIELLPILTMYRRIACADIDYARLLVRNIGAEAWKRIPEAVRARI